MAHADDLQFFETKRGVKLHERRSTVKGKRLKALLVLCHGYGHHIECVRRLIFTYNLNDIVGA
jgi:alpha-beta hydrolase superfamily lysophospholipase